MPFPLALPRTSWGRPDAERRALLIHGLGSDGALMWGYGVALADAGWRADAVDLRGHGSAPRALDCTLEAYAADVAEVHPSDGGPWDLVIAHSLGGAAAVITSADHPDWTRRLVLVDPAIHLGPEDRAQVRQGQEESFADPGAAAVRAAHPHWHELDIELKAASTLRASRWMVEQTSEQNETWDVRGPASRLAVPTHVLGADPAVFSIFTGATAAEVLRNPLVTMSVIEGAGHSLHRDRPEATMNALLEVLP
jgi:pimeloyl-ACP methyl ester carboxylesterase